MRYIYMDVYTHTHTQTYTHNGILLSHKKEWNFTICGNMDGLRGYYAKWNKSEQDKYCILSLTYGIQNVQQTSEYNRKAGS